MDAAPRGGSGVFVLERRPSAPRPHGPLRKRGALGGRLRARAGGFGIARPGDGGPIDLRRREPPGRAFLGLVCGPCEPLR